MPMYIIWNQVKSSKDPVLNKALNTMSKVCFMYHLTQDPSAPSHELDEDEKPVSSASKTTRKAKAGGMCRHCNKLDHSVKLLQCSRCKEASYW